MKAAVAAVARLSAGLARLFMAASFAAMVAITAVVGWQVFGRYVLNATPVWAERTALLLVLYFSLLGAAVGVRERFHLGIVFLRDALPPGPRRAVEAATHLLVGGFGACMAWYGTGLALATVTHTIPTLGLSESFTYWPVPLAGLAIALFALEHLIRLAAAVEDRPEAVQGSV